MANTTLGQELELERIRIGTTRVRIGTARRVNKPAARAHFAAGGTILVHDGHETELPVTDITTVHNRDQITWPDLVDMVDLWRNRHVSQGFYIVTYAPNTCTWPPVRVPASEIRPGDVLPLCGTVDRVSPGEDSYGGTGVRISFPPGTTSRFAPVALYALTVAASDHLYVSRQVPR